MRSDDVVGREGNGGEERIIYMGACGKMNDGVDAFRAEKIVDEAFGTDVTLAPADVRVIKEGGDICKGGAIVEFVKDYKLAVWKAGYEKLYDMRAYEACSTG